MITKTKHALRIFGKLDACSSDQECAEKLGFQNLAKLNQVHGNVIHIVREPSSGNLKGDGLITNVPGLALSIRFADCQAFAITVPKKNVIGVVQTKENRHGRRQVQVFKM